MARYALIITATGAVENVIEYDGSAPFTPPTGQELRVATDDAEPGGTWNGSAFVRAPNVAPTRTEVLMVEVQRNQKWDDDSEAAVDKTADEIAAEKLELKNLLLAELQAGDLPQDRTQTLLRLERE
jgi:hypothetical protein